MNEITEKNSNGEDITRRISAISCKGCKAGAILEEISGSLIDSDRTIYKPPRLWSPRPKWIEQIENIDPNLYGILDEVYSVANEEQFRLFAMGVRATLDHVMNRIIGDIGTFEQKMNEMVKQEYISKKQKEMLEIVIDAGSAAAHRGYKPPVDLLSQMLTVMETIVRDYYITGPMLSTLKIKIPPRPSRKKP